MGIISPAFSNAQEKVAGKQKNISSVPFPHLPFNNDTGKIQFAIISDLWGGNRPGVFEDAVSKIELLQPQFVMSVGDLINGATYDTLLIDKQRDAFEQSIRPLTMPFFYVPGNHDIGNPVMEKQWIKRLGNPYYSFVYKNALFLVINTEDGGHGGIGDQQIEYFKTAIYDNPKVRWTFLFMHRPVWQGLNGKEEGYEKIEALLQDRNYTLFSGHHHTYVNLVKNGRKHFVLGSTGGGSDLRGEKYGEFDHITMVTLGKEEPKIVNLALNGIVKEDVVNEKTFPLTQTLIDENWMHIRPVVSEQQWEKTITAQIEFENTNAVPLVVSGNLCAKNGYHISPCNIDITIAPKQKISQQIVIANKNNMRIDLAKLSSIDLTLNGSYMYNNTSYLIPATKKLLLSWKLPVPDKKNIYKPVSKTFHGIDTSAMIPLNNPEYLDRKWYWSGTKDAFVRFKLEKEGGYIHIVALVTDDQWVLSDKGQKDVFYLDLENADGGHNRIVVSPDSDQFNIEGKGTLRNEDVVLKRYFTDSILLMDYRISVDKLRKKDHSVRINIGYRDQDNQPDKQYAVFFWKPVWETIGDYKNSGSFLIK
ncbi:MAG: metallophosphoesterase [Bacteroidota bacterium]